MGEDEDKKGAVQQFLPSTNKLGMGLGVNRGSEMCIYILKILDGNGTLFVRRAIVRMCNLRFA